MAVIVPGNRRHAIAEPDAEPHQRLGELLGAQLSGGIGGAVKWALRRARDDFGLGVIAGRVSDQRLDQQRPIHHQAAHQEPSCGRLFFFSTGIAQRSCESDTRRRVEETLPAAPAPSYERQTARERRVIRRALPNEDAPAKTTQIPESDDPAVYLRSELLGDDHGPFLQFADLQRFGVEPLIGRIFR
jgi:hypothetical protein